MLKECLRPVIPQYDYILVDSPPALGVLTVNAFTLADVVLIPVLTDVYSLQGITRLHDTVSQIKNALNPALQFGGCSWCGTGRGRSFRARCGKRRSLSAKAWACRC